MAPLAYLSCWGYAFTDTMMECAVCLWPVRIERDDYPIFVACRRCWQCRKRRRLSVVGRLLAEADVSHSASFVTLTYAPQHPQSAVLVARDPQLLLKRLRRAGCKVRYMVAGEYGPLRGRAHWHGVLFWADARSAHIAHSAISDGRWKFWPWGWATLAPFTRQRAAYVCKYLTKAMASEASRFPVTRPLMSKRPALGHEYFMRYVEHLVQNGLRPDGYYRIGDRYTNRGTRLVYPLDGSTAERVASTYVRRWREVHGSALWPQYRRVDSNIHTSGYDEVADFIGRYLDGAAAAAARRVQDEARFRPPSSARFAVPTEIARLAGEVVCRWC